MMSAANGKEVRSSRGSVTGSRRQALMGSAAWPRSLVIGVLTAGLAAPAGLAVSVMTADEALAACGNTGTFPNITAFDCTGTDTDGHSIGTFVLGAPTSGNTSNIVGTVAVGGSITNSAGSPALSIVMQNGADLTLTGTDPFSAITSTNANAFQFGTRHNGSTITLDWAGRIDAVNGNAVNGVSRSIVSGNQTVDLTFQSSAKVLASGSTDLLGVPVTGGGVVLVNLNTAAMTWTVTNKGEFHTQNDAIFMSNAAGTGTHIINNEGSLGTSVSPLGGSGAAIFAPLAGSTGTVNNDNGTIWAAGNGGPTGDFGAIGVVVGGNAQVSNIEGTANTVDDAAILAVSLLGGSATVDSTDGSVTSTNGPGIVAISLLGTSTVDAGEVNAGTDAASLFGFSFPAIPGFPTLSGGVLSLANGDAIANAHGNIMTDGSFGALALSLNGNATVTADAGIAIDPLIGEAAVVLFGNGAATIINNAATVDGDLVGLMALNLGTGNAVITSTGSVVTAPVAATAVADGPTADATVTNQGAGVFNGAVVLAAGQDAKLTNTQDSQINIPSISGIVMLAGRDAIITNNMGSDIDFAGPLSFNFMSAGRDATIDNYGRGTTFTLNGPVSANVMDADNDATINNYNGADFTIDGALAANVMLADNNATIRNYNGGDFTFLGTLTGNFMDAGNDAVIENYNGGDFGLLGAINGNFMIADNDAVIRNYNGGNFVLAGLANGNFMQAGNDALIENYNGGDMTLAGLANGNLMFAGNDALIRNYNGATLNLLGLNGQLMVATGDATIDNYNGGSINLIGVNALGFSAGAAATVNNSAFVNVAGFATLLGLDDYNNAGGATSMMEGISDGGLLTIPVYNTGIGDVTVVSGSFNGGADSQFAVDSFLGGVAGSSSDLLIAGQINHGNGPGDPDGGATAVLVNDTNPGFGAFNPVGIPVIGVVSGQTQLGDFYLANGPIDKGLFSYDLFLDSPGSLAAAWTPPFFDDADAWVLASYADATAYEFPQTISIAQGMWHTLSGTWLDRAADLRSMHGSTGGGGADPVVPSAQKDDNGVWARIIGFGADRDVSYTTEPFPDQFVTVDADYSERMGAIQGGIDHAFDSGSGSFVVGVLAGYAYNNIDFDGAGDTAKISAPHVGAYASWISDGTYVSGLIKADFLNVDYDLVGLGEQASTDGYSLGGRVEAGHRFQMGRAFIEPVASLAYVHTSLDNITAGGTDITFNDGSSLRGKIGARLGFTSMTASGQFDPYVHAYVGNEFLGDNSAFFASGPGLTVTDDVSGIFGEVGGGFNYLTTDRRTSIYGQANYIFADGYQAGNVKLGVRMNW
jgi:outer membrane autotransporter protein